jgi:hypothetical protein
VVELTLKRDREQKLPQDPVKDIPVFDSIDGSGAGLALDARYLEERLPHVGTRPSGTPHLKPEFEGSTRHFVTAKFIASCLLRIGRRERTT